MKTITNLFRQHDDLNKTFLAKQTQLEALKSDPVNNLTVSEEELWRHTTLQAYDIIQLEMRDVKEKIKTLQTQ